MHDQWLFFGNVFAHLVASMSSIVSFAFAVYEATKNKRIESWVFFAIGSFFLIVAFDQAWQDEHHNVRALITEKTNLSQERNFWKDQSYSKDASLRTRDELLGRNYSVLAHSQSSLAT